METHAFSWAEAIAPKPLRLLIRSHVAAEPQAMGYLSRRQQRNVAAGLQSLVDKRPETARAFAFDVAAGTPIVVIITSRSLGHGGGQVCVDKSPCLTASGCRCAGYWVANLNRHLLVEEMEALQGIPLGRLRWPSGMSRSVYGAMIGNSFTVGVVGRVALRLLRTIGKLPVAWPDVWADESQAWTWPAVGGGACPGRRGG